MAPVSSPPAEAKPGGQHPFVEAFAAGGRDTGAMFRWWWPSSVDAGVAVEQLREVAAAGYKGVEIAFVMDGTDYEVDPDEYEYGDANWQAAVKAVLEEANELGIQVDLTLGGRWPAAIPGLDVSSPAASQELVVGTVTVAGGESYDDAVPPPPVKTYPDRTSENGVVTTETKVSEPSLVTVTAGRCVVDCSETRPQIDLTSVIDLSEHVVDGHVSWTAPDSGTWSITGYWSRGTAQRNDAPFGNTVSLLSDPESRVINHYSKAGTEAFIEYFSGLLDDETLALLKASGGSFFEDSLELKFAHAWTAEFFEAFEDTNGYSVLPYLPVLALAEPASPFAPSTPVYSFAEGQAEIAEGVSWDVEQTLNDLYLNNHVKPITEWANSLGLTYRAQAYGAPIDPGQAARLIDITECESLGCSAHDFRTAATSVAMAGKNILTSEMLPGGFGNLYGFTQPEIVALANREYALGVNQLVFHGLPYPHIPPSADGTIVDSAAHWPGFHAFSSFIGEAFGPRQPSWTMEPDVAGYYARTQQALQSGRARLDVAVMSQSLVGAAPAFDVASLTEAGFSYGYVTPGSLHGQDVAGGVLAPDGPGFKALVVDDDAMDVATAEEILRLARAGLTVIVVDGGPQQARGYAASAAEALADDQAVRRIFEQIVDLPTGHATAVADVATVLAGQDVRPDADVADRRVQAVRRDSKDFNIYVLVNTTDEAISTTASLLGGRKAVPYLLDAWDGEVMPIGIYTTTGDRTSVEVTLEPGAAVIVALADHKFAEANPAAVHVTSTDASDAQWARGAVTLTADDNGTYRTKLSNGRVIRTRVNGVPAERALTEWDLRLDEWLPGEGNDPSNVTRHVERILEDVPLTSWSEIPEIADAVGVGTYTTTVEVREEFDDARAVLDLGAVSGSYRVRVNGELVDTPDQLGARVDLGDRLKAGHNVIEVTVASPLLNRLRVHRPSEFGSRTPTVNGLLGPAVLDPYRVVRDR